MPNAGSALSATASGAAAGSTFGPVGTVVGGAVGLLGSLLNKQKSAPVVPFTPLDLGAAQQQSLANNKAAMPSIEQLLAQSNTFQQGQASSLLERAIPGWGKLQASLTNLATTTAQNPYQLPADVTQNLARIAAERGISAGTRGQFNDFSLLRDLGVNSLQYGASRISQAQGLAQTLAALAPRVNPMSPLSFLTTPQEQLGVNQYNEATGRQVRQGGANADTAASNYNSTNLWSNLLQGLFAGGQLGGMFAAPSTPRATASSPSPGAVSPQLPVGAGPDWNPNWGRGG